MAGGGGVAECRTSALPNFLPRDVQGVARALLRRPALLPTALLRLRCLVWVDSTSRSSDDATTRTYTLHGLACTAIVNPNSSCVRVYGGRTTAMTTTLTWSTSGDTLCRVGRPCQRSEVRRSDSFKRELRPWVPKCPSGVDSEWQLLGKSSCSLTQLFPSPKCCPAVAANE